MVVLAGIDWDGCGKAALANAARLVIKRHIEAYDMPPSSKRHFVDQLVPQLNSAGFLAVRGRRHRGLDNQYCANR